VAHRPLYGGANTFLVDLAYPHIAFAQALILLTMLGAWLA